MPAYFRKIYIPSLLAAFPFFFAPQMLPPAHAQILEINCDSIHVRPGGGTSFYENNPTYIDNGGDNFAWQYAAPAEMGVDENILNTGLSTLENSPSIFSFILLRNGRILSEKYFNGSAPQHSNNVHSASKSIISAMIGIAIGQGFIDNIDQSIFDFFPEYPLAGDDPEKANISIRHLLNMTAGLDWKEDNYEYQIEDENNWVNEILAYPLAHGPGSFFKYSTGNTHLLSAILTRAAGTSNCEYTHRQLLYKMGIAAEHWGRDPQEVQSGGYNFYITPRELAKFGLLYMDGGKWMGEQLVPQAWVETSLQNQATVGGNYNYGYCWWLTDISGYEIKKAWGYGGQYICLIPELDIIVVSTSNTRDYFEELDIDEFIENYIIPAVDPEWTNTDSGIISKKPAIYISPNPFSDKAFFNFYKINGFDKYSISVFDILGRQVRTVDCSGGGEIIFRRGGLPAGVYIYRVFEKGDIVGAGKFVIGN